MNASRLNEQRAPFLLGLWAETSNLALILSEWIWLAALYTVLFGLKQEVMPVFVSLAIPGILGYTLSKLLHHLMISKVWLRFILGVWIAAALTIWLGGFVFAWEQINLASLASGGFIALIGATKVQSLMLQVIMFLLMVRRSVSLPATTVNSWQVLRSSQIGLLMFLVYGLTTAWDKFLINLAPFALYLFTILVSLTSARLAELGTEYGGKSPAFSRWWLISIGLLAFAFVVVGSATGWLVGVVFVETASAILNFVYYAVIVTLLVVLSPILLLLIALVPFFNQLVSNLMRNNFSKQAEFIVSILQPKPENGQSMLKAMDSGLTIFLAVVSLLVMAAVIFGVRLRRHGRGSSTDEEIGDLAAVQKLLKDGQKKKSFFESTLGQARRWLASARIRRIYAQLMKSCADLNTPRPPSFTPLEFQPQLDMLFPDLTHETRLITSTYLKVRYGEYPEMLEDMEAARNAWEKIKVNANAAINLRKRRMQQT